LTLNATPSVPQRVSTLVFSSQTIWSLTKFTMKSINIYNTKYVFHNECDETCWTSNTLIYFFNIILVKHRMVLLRKSLKGHSLWDGGSTCQILSWSGVIFS
jgi:hypothetical protein